MGKLIFSLQQHNPLLKMLFAALLVFFVATAAAAPSDIVVGYDLDDHEHTQKGQAGTAVTGSYSFTAADGVEHVVTYIADDKGYRVVGDATIESAPRPTTPRPTPAPTRAPTAAPVVKTQACPGCARSRHPSAIRPARSGCSTSPDIQHCPGQLWILLLCLCRSQPQR